jgi:Holliday junction DNA helicase RuvA
VEGLASAAAASTGAREDAASALVNLGYQQIDAQKAVAKAAKDLGDDADEGALIKAALKSLAGG